MSANKFYHIELIHRRAMPGEPRAARAKSAFKKMASRYMRRALKKRLDARLVELHVEVLAEQREIEKEDRELRMATEALLDTLDRQEEYAVEDFRLLNDDYEDDFDYSYGDYSSFDDPPWWSEEPFEVRLEGHNPNRNVYLAEEQKATWLKGGKL